MMRPLKIAACSALTTAVLASSALAQQPVAPGSAPAAIASATPVAAPAISGNAAQGRTLTYTCQGCHGIPGYKNAYPNYHVPKIGGQSAAYLVEALTEYQQGTRRHPTMQAQAESFSEQDVADIAAFLSSLK